MTDNLWQRDVGHTSVKLKPNCLSSGINIYKLNVEINSETKKILFIIRGIK